MFSITLDLSSYFYNTAPPRISFKTGLLGKKKTSPPTRPVVGSETVPRNVPLPNFYPEFDRDDNRDGDHHGYNDDHPNPDADHNQLTDEQLRHRAT